MRWTTSKGLQLEKPEVKTLRRAAVILQGVMQHGNNGEQADATRAKTAIDHLLDGGGSVADDGGGEDGIEDPGIGLLTGMDEDEPRVAGAGVAE